MKVIIYDQRTYESEEEVDDEIKPCPFCGTSYFRIEIGSPTSRVFCRQCGACGPFKIGEANAAIEVWNKRAEYNPLYLEYCKEQGFENSPEEMKIYDKKKYPGGCMAGFISWRQKNPKKSPNGIIQAVFQENKHGK